MKTALVQTTFWDEESFGELNLDTKLVYVHLLTNPSRGLINVMRINRAVIGARVGLSRPAIELCIGQLARSGYIAICDDWITLIHDHVQAKKGRFTAQAIERELAKVPQYVIDDLSRFVTGIIPEYKDKDNKKPTLGAVIKASL